MSLVLNGSGIVSSNIVDGTLVNVDIADLAASKLTGALPAISGASLTGLKAGSAAFAARHTGSSWSNVSSGATVVFNNDSTGDSFDTDGVYNTSTYKFTAPATGVYTFWFSIYTAQNDSSNGFGFQKNSSRLDLQASTSDWLSYFEIANDHNQTGSVVINLSSGDTIAVIAASTSDYYTGHSQWGGCRLA